MKISVFSIVKNEAQFIGYGVMSLLPYVDEIVYADGNSTDGTLDILKHIKKKYDTDGKIKIFERWDFKDFKEDYVRLFNDLMKECHADYLWYCHPDMILTDPGKLIERDSWEAKAFYVNIRSFAGEDMNLEITRGRTNRWKTIMKNAFGLHYWGHYGHEHEDMYFQDITGNSHVVHGEMRKYPFRVEDSGIKLEHMCECKPRKRREQKMDTVLRTISGIKDERHLAEILANHPRVHLQNHDGPWGHFRFEPRKDPIPDVFQKYKEEFDSVLKEAV